MKKFKSSGIYFNYLIFIHLVLFVSQVSFSLASIYLIHTSRPMLVPDYKMNQLISWGMPILYAFCHIFCIILSKNRLGMIRNKAKFKSKLSSYLHLFLLRDFLITIPSYVAIAIVTVTNYQLYFIYASVNILVMIFLWPTRKRFINELDLNFDESAIVNNRSALLN